VAGYQLRATAATMREKIAEELLESKREAASLADDNERLTAELDDLRTQVAQAVSDKAEAHGRAEQLANELVAAREEIGIERAASERARTALAKAELRLEAVGPQLPPCADVQRVYARRHMAVRLLARWLDGPSPDQPARHDIQVGDVRVRNVPTNIRNYMTGGTERHGNSIFIFEIANLCIAHLGHLHHTLTQQQLNEIGRLDAVMVPVDGGVTLDLEGMSEVLAALKRAGLSARSGRVSIAKTLVSDRAGLGPSGAVGPSSLCR